MAARGGDDSGVIAMTPKSQLLISLAAAAALIGAAVAAPVPQGGRKFTTTLSGQNEVNAAHPTGGAGDPDGTGTAAITINVGQRRVCWDITVNNIAAPMRGHIHNAPVLVNGPIVVGFFEPATVALKGCTPTTQPVDRALLTDIIQHPQNYYVNVHTADFPAGAIRGQLSK
jgi:hypothetical protein